MAYQLSKNTHLAQLFTELWMLESDFHVFNLWGIFAIVNAVI